VNARGAGNILHRIDRAGAPPRCVSVQAAETSGPAAKKNTKIRLAR
jgi:hypothetical protein